MFREEPRKLKKMDTFRDALTYMFTRGIVVEAAAFRQQYSQQRQRREQQLREREREQQQEQLYRRQRLQLQQITGGVRNCTSSLIFLE
jgi:hypothetical protein